MEDSAVIQLATIYEIGDAIIDTAGTTEDFTLRDVPRLIREDVYNKGYADGEANGTGGYDNGYADGKQAQYEGFWNTFQDNGNRTDYRAAFAGWRDEYIRPLHKVVPTVARSLSTTFEACPKLKKVEAEYFDFSKVPYGTANNQGAYYTFASCTSLEEIEDVGFPALYSYIYTFAWCGSLHTIAKVTFDENTIIENTFNSLHELVNLTTEGTINKNGLNLQWSKKLSKASIISVINVLSNTVSADGTKSITLSRTAQQAAFSGFEGVDEWAALIASKPNWTINLV